MASVISSVDARPDMLALVRNLHDTVVQRLCGVSLVLHGDWSAADERQEVCQREVADALAELRTALESCLEPTAAVPAATQEAELRAVREAYPDATVRCTGFDRAADLPVATQELVEAAVGEGLRNVRKHARPRHVDVRLDVDEDLVRLTVHNDGVSPASGSGCGLGLRLLQTEASLLGGALESIPGEDATWDLHLLLPAAA